MYCLDVKFKFLQFYTVNSLISIGQGVKPEALWGAQTHAHVWCMIQFLPPHPIQGDMNTGMGKKPQDMAAAY